MRMTDAMRLAGGRQKLLDLFHANGEEITSQAMSRWVRNDRVPKMRVLQLRQWCSHWFHGEASGAHH